MFEVGRKIENIRLWGGGTSELKIKSIIFRNRSCT